MNVLWLSAPYRKDDIMANKDAVWVYTENEEQNGGGEITEFMRSAENCHPLIVRQHHGKDGFYKEDNILRTTQVIERYFNSLFIKIKHFIIIYKYYLTFKFITHPLEPTNTDLMFCNNVV